MNTSYTYSLIMMSFKRLLCLVFISLSFLCEAHGAAPDPSPLFKVKNITIITSLACSACKRFFESKFQDIEKFCTDKGIRITFEPFPVDLATLLATSIAYSMGDKSEETYRELVERQDEWHGKNWRKKLVEICTEDLGIAPDIITEVMDRKSPLEDKILMNLKSFLRRHKIEYVPAILINDTLVVDADLMDLKKGVEAVESGKVKPVQQPLPFERADDDQASPSQPAASF